MVFLITEFFTSLLHHLFVRQIEYKSHILRVLGWRVGSRKVVLLVTDGQSNVKRDLTIPNADKLKKLGVDIYVVAVGPNSRIDIVEVVKVAGPGSSNPNEKREKYLFRVTDYNGLLKIMKLVVKNGKIGGTPFSSPC